jgi:DNA-nicking Smr family endonuclease
MRRRTGEAAQQPSTVTGAADAFEREMADVVPLKRDPRGRVRAAPRVAPPPVAAPLRPSATRAATELDRDGDDTDFAAPGVDRRELRKLKRGEYVAMSRLDLHGKTATEAGAIVRQFLDRSRRKGQRCVCIVHGRGVHSAGRTPVLKRRVRADLASHGAVLAFADAPPSDGGAGAVYVLLRKS